MTPVSCFRYWRDLDDNLVIAMQAIKCVVVGDGAVGECHVSCVPSCHWRHNTLATLGDFLAHFVAMNKILAITMHSNSYIINVFMHPPS